MTAPRGVLAGAVAAAVVAAAAAAAVPGAAPPADASGPTVSIIDNAFLRDVQRPVLHVRAGTRVTWRWRSQQSHSVMVRSGPQRFASTIRNRGSYVHRFTGAGTYRIVCALHAPGMQMTVVVRR